MLEITLTKRASVDTRARINEHLLKDEAFIPKIYTLKLERGAFYEPSLIRKALENIHTTPTYLYRLTFDTSPYPPEQEWSKIKGGPAKFKFWELVDFVSDETEDFIIK